MNNTINEIKNSLEGINSRITEAEERITDLEGKIVEITTTEQNKEKRMKRIEDSLRDLWDNIKHTNIQIIEVAEEEREKERIGENIWRDYSWKLPKYGKGNSQSSPERAENPIQDKSK